MKPVQIALALACVMAISAGQMLFKIVGTSLNAPGPMLSARTVCLSLLAFSIYGLATIGWIYLLRGVPLSKAYPFMALSFCLVPAIGYLVLQEKLSSTYPIGVLFIVCGVLLVGRSG
jgi:drug/metabolite transporter (DMT)-like permease